MGKPIQQTDFRWGPKPNNAHSQYKRLKTRNTIFRCNKNIGKYLVFLHNVLK